MPDMPPAPHSSYALYALHNTLALFFSDSGHSFLSNLSLQMCFWQKTVSNVQKFNLIIVIVRLFISRWSTPQLLRYKKLLEKIYSEMRYQWRSLHIVQCIFVHWFAWHCTIAHDFVYVCCTNFVQCTGIGLHSIVQFHNCKLFRVCLYIDLHWIVHFSHIPLHWQEREGGLLMGRKMGNWDRGGLSSHLNFLNLDDDFYLVLFCQELRFLRGAIKIIFRKNLGFWPNQRTPHPPPRKLGRQKKKKKFNVYFAF